MSRFSTLWTPWNWSHLRSRSTFLGSFSRSPLNAWHSVIIFAWIYLFSSEIVNQCRKSIFRALVYWTVLVGISFGQSLINCWIFRYLRFVLCSKPYVIVAWKVVETRKSGCLNNFTLIFTAETYKYVKENLSLIYQKFILTTQISCLWNVGACSLLFASKCWRHSSKIH